ncbi:leucine-rich repeat domain-containing protein [Gimesia aquarii]|uniref:Leucine Rich repeats (2 copies) n=1 Tax=Gimesia aquarii TaxID=2527964 RepID=A0A517W497_9PLAN|nr:hypothetical protein [Gimesia aquarii]QDU00061.1 Leucine Rich repeats (2 copies) [Gimesia aquarii]
MSFDSYHKWLGIPPEKQPPHYYQLLGISVNEQDSEVIQTAAQRQRSSIEDHLHGAHHREATQLIYEIEEAELTLLNPELREDYDKRVKLVLKRQKSKQRLQNLDPDSNRPAGEGSGLMPRFLGITSVILVGFLIMAYFAYQRPRTEEEKKVLRAQPISMKKQPAPTKPTVTEKKENPVPTPAPIAKTEAEAITWIFSVGGKITTKAGQNVERAADLPQAPFEVTSINLINCDVTDETLPNILPLTSVQSLVLTSTKITDKSIPVINQLKNLLFLFAAGTNTTNQGFARLSNQLKLRTLHINNNLRLDDEVIKTVVQYPQLMRVSLAQTSITGRSLETMASLKDLIGLQIHLTQIDDKGLEQLQAFPELKDLLLGGPLNSEHGILKTLLYFKELNVLWIFDVSITDTGANNLATMTSLKELRLIRTQISDANVNRLKAALPDTKITVEK